ncbi:MAG: hypothetical protein KatS3mg033_2078 [Thermonema sp.]|uniref:lytic transglycosylase domain-containing protein n=1 Tax=Thermonema sp. TaxID=2231181 RepID=UPI0021DEF890|nr:lytic transglycosylase domain-containing protein [Thermonema sp.]GIV40278.1 MAG: hypothetical protein KatS3mg033_2078 [Thermonema sp.]
MKKIYLLYGCLFAFLQCAWAQSQEQRAAYRVNIPLPRPVDSVDAQFRDYVPQLHEELIKERLACAQQTIPLTYHPVVLRFIKKYLIDNRRQTVRFLQRTPRYFPIFEEALRRHGLPEELKYLSIIESALLPRARSWASAVGLWQFMSFTGREYGLRIDRYIDERMDPYKSTEAACLFLKDLYHMFGDWHLALAAYNCGAGNVRRAIRRSGDKTSFWEIYPYLPRETRAYVPFYIAMVYVMRYHEAHNIPYPQEVEPFLESDTIHVPPKVSLQQLAQGLDISPDTLKALNPHLKYYATPPYGTSFALRIPAHKKAWYALHKEEILDLQEEDIVLTETPSIPVQKVAYTPGGHQKATYHRVRKGESLGIIAQKYGVSVSALKQWNHLRGNTIYPNQRLIIWTKQSITPDSGPYYTVRPGDTLWSIAQRHGISIDQLRALNPSLQGDKIVKGQRLRVR